jgi:hypothetical protein
MAWYAWSPIRKTVDTDSGKTAEDIKVGDTVSKSDLKDDWDYLVESGAVREQKYPDIPDFQSPTEYFKEMAAKMQTGDLKGDEISKLQEFLLTNAVDPGAGIPPPPGVEEAIDEQIEEVEKEVAKANK